MSITFASVCSGIGSPEAAWASLGWRAAFVSEIEPFPRAVLAHRFPGVNIHGDFTTIKGGDYEPIDLLVGGTPCQDFSIAGLRAGLAGDRGNLTLEFVRLAQRLNPRWVVWENVPGVLSIDGGRAFGAFLGGMAQLGYGFAYRVLDAQYFGVPQRRRRVFVVCHLGDWRRAAAVLFERESLRGDSPPSREAGEEVADSTSASTSVGSLMPAMQPIALQDVRAVEKMQNGKGWNDDGLAYTVDTHATQGVAMPIPFDTTQITSAGNYSNPHPGAPCHPLAAGAHPPAVAFTAPTLTSANNPSRSPQSAEIMQQVRAVHAASMQVRRLTPRECERLQGFPDDWTLVPMRGKPAADGPRYKAIGNSMAVPVMRWIGERIELVERLAVI